jgi:hypothetical protein
MDKFEVLFMSIKDDDGFMNVFSRYTMGTGDMSVEYYTRNLSQEDFETNQTSLMNELIEYIDKYVEEKLFDQMHEMRYVG